MLFQAAVSQTAMTAGAVRVAGRRDAAGNPGRDLVTRARCLSRSMVMRQRPTAVMRARGRLALAVPDRTEVMAARRASVKEISRGCTGCPARLPSAEVMAAAAASRGSC